ncbi:S4 domain-containing protein, partial [Accumulibacter sp.]
MAEVSKSSVIQELITENEHGQRLDNLLLKKCKGVPKSHVYRIVRSGEVRVNGRRTAVSYRLQIGDVVRIPPMRTAQVEQEVVDGAALKAQLPVVYEDEGLLIV